MNKPSQVLFYYPQHFNRSAGGTNPFFDKLLEICEKNDIPYLLLEEPDKATDKPRNPKARKADAFFWTVTIIRKLLRCIMPSWSFHERERIVAQVFNIITLGRYKFPVYVTISGSMYHLFASLNPSAKVFDMQHGVLMKGHRTFFDDQERLRPQFYKPNLHWLMWGKGYKELFERGEEETLKGRVHVVGYPIEKQARRDLCSERVALVSLQFTADWDKEMLEKQKRLLDETLSYFVGSGYRVLVRHHPRYNNVIDLGDVISKYDFAEITSHSFNQLLGEISLHVTYNSTTAFEYAQYGIPSIFMGNEEFPYETNIMYREFQYPLFENMEFKDALAYLDAHDVCELMKKWYGHFYSPFEEKAFLTLMTDGNTR